MAAKLKLILIVAILILWFAQGAFAGAAAPATVSRDAMTHFFEQGLGNLEQ